MYEVAFGLWPAYLGTPGISLTGGGLVHSALCSSLAGWRNQKYIYIIEHHHTRYVPLQSVSLSDKSHIYLSCYLKTLIFS